MSAALQGAAGLGLLFVLAGTVFFSRNPDRTTRRLAAGFAALVLAGLIVWTIRGDWFAASGVESGGDESCEFARGC